MEQEKHTLKVFSLLLYKITKVAIVVDLLNIEQTVYFILRARNIGMVYPTYTWIHIEPKFSFTQQDVLKNFATGNLLLTVRKRVKNDTLMLILGLTYAKFKAAYLKKHNTHSKRSQF